MTITGFPRTGRGGISNVLQELRLKPEAYAVTHAVSRHHQVKTGLRRSFSAFHVIERVPRLRIGQHLLCFYVMMKNGVQYQRKAGRKIKLRNGLPGPRELPVVLWKFNDRG